MKCASGNAVVPGDFPVQTVQSDMSRTRQREAPQMSQLDQAIRDHYAERDAEQGPVVAWVLIAATDNNGSAENDVIWIDTPDGQRGFVTSGLVAEASAIGAQRHGGDA